MDDLGSEHFFMDFHDNHRNAITQDRRFPENDIPLSSLDIADQRAVFECKSIQHLLQIDGRDAHGFVGGQLNAARQIIFFILIKEHLITAIRHSAM